MSRSVTGGGGASSGGRACSSDGGGGGGGGSGFASACCGGGGSCLASCGFGSSGLGSSFGPVSFTVSGEGMSGAFGSGFSTPATSRGLVLRSAGSGGRPRRIGGVAGCGVGVGALATGAGGGGAGVAAGSGVGAAFSSATEGAATGASIVISMASSK